MTDLILVRVNCPDKVFAEEIAQACVTQKLAACANISGPVMSIYEWEGQLESGEEWLVWLKTDRAHWTKIEAFIAARHPHDVPAILGLPCFAANTAYEDWLTLTLDD